MVVKLNSAVFNPHLAVPSWNVSAPGQALSPFHARPDAALQELTSSGPQAARSPLARNVPSSVHPIMRVRSSHEHDVNLLVANYGKLPPHHRIVDYLDKLTKKVRPGFDGEVVVLVNHPDENAFVMSGSQDIFITQRLLNKVRYEEELAYVLSHEHVHIAEGHTGQRGEGYVENQGIKRMSEVEADFKGAESCDDAGVNPLGAIEFHRNRESSSVVHGSSLDRALNLLHAIPFMDLSSLSRELTPLPSFLRKTGMGQPLAKRVVDMPFTHVEKIVRTANIYQLRVMLEVLARVRRRKGDYEKRFELLRDRLEATVKGRLRRRGIDVKYTAISMEYFFHLSGIDSHSQESYTDEEFAWLADNHLSVLLSGKLGVEPLDENNAHSFATSFAEFTLELYVGDELDNYLKHKVIRAREIGKKCLSLESQEAVRNYLRELLKKGGVPLSLSLEKEIDYIANEFVKEERGDHEFGYIPMPFRIPNLIYFSRFFAALSYPSFKKDLRGYVEWNARAGGAVQKRLGREVLPYSLDPTVETILKLARAIGERNVFGSYLKGFEFVDAVFGALEEMEMHDAVSLRRLLETYRMVQYFPLLDDFPKARWHEESVSERFIPFIERSFAALGLAGSKRGVDFTRQVLLKVFQSTSPYINIDLMTITASELEALHRLLTDTRLYRRNVTVNFSLRRPHEYEFLSEDKLWNVSKDKKMNRLDAFEMLRIWGRGIYDAIAFLEHEGAEAKLEAALRIARLNNNVSSVLGNYHTRAAVYVEINGTTEGIVLDREVFESPDLLALSRLELVYERAGGSIDELLGSERYRTIARTSLRTFADQEHQGPEQPLPQGRLQLTTRMHHVESEP